MSEQSVEDELNEAVAIIGDVMVDLSVAKQAAGSDGFRLDVAMIRLSKLSYRLGIIEGMLLGKKYDQANSKKE
jgi:hypothetical protein